MSSANFRCDIDVDKAAGTLYFMARYHGVVCTPLAGAPTPHCPQLWSNFSPLYTLFATALDTRAAATAATPSANPATTTAPAKANATIPASALRPAVRAGALLLASALGGKLACLLLPPLSG